MTTQPLQPFQKTQLQPPFGPSVGSPCHPRLTTTLLSYRLAILKLPPPPCAALLVCHAYIMPYVGGRESCYQMPRRNLTGSWFYGVLSTSMLPQLQLDHIATRGFCIDVLLQCQNCSRTSVSGTSGNFVRLGRKRHGVDAAACIADGELRQLPGAVLPSLPKQHRAA